MEKKKIPNLNDLRDRAFECAQSHGFYDQPFSEKHEKMMLICEIAEAVQADRENRHADIDTFNKSIERYKQKCETNIFDDGFYEVAFEDWIKDTFEDEITDIIIRLLSIYGCLGTDLSFIQRTMNNEDLFPLFQSHREFTSDAIDLCQKVLEMNLEKGHISDWPLFILFLLAQSKGIDIEWHILHKMSYNELRPRLDGKKY